MKMVHAKPTDDKFKALGYPREPTSYKKIMQSINHHYKEHNIVCKKLKCYQKKTGTLMKRIVALKKQLTLTTKERDRLVKRYNLVWNEKKQDHVEK